MYLVCVCMCKQFFNLIGMIQLNRKKSNDVGVKGLHYGKNWLSDSLRKCAQGKKEDKICEYLMKIMSLSFNEDKCDSWGIYIVKIHMLKRNKVIFFMLYTLFNEEIELIYVS